MGQDVEKIVLVVEDDPFIAMDACDAIESRGYRCLLAHDLRTAFRILEGYDLSCALLDFDLGGENSIAVAEKLQEAGHPYCFVSGRSRKEIIEITGGDARVFSKPVDYRLIAEGLLEAA